MKPIDFHVLDDDMDANNNSHFIFLSANSILQKIDIDDISKFLRNNLGKLRMLCYFKQLKNGLRQRMLNYSINTKFF